MRVRGLWVCAATVVGATVLAGCKTATPATKYDAAYELEAKADKQLKANNHADAARNYTDAIAKYNEFIAQNRTTAYANLVPWAMYKIALCYRGLHKKPEAMAAYEQVVDKYPGTEPAAWSRAEMAELEKMPEMKPLPAPMPAR